MPSSVSKVVDHLSLFFPGIRSYGADTGEEFLERTSFNPPK
jgi:hypothetical protein